MFVVICGIRSLEEAQVAADCSADAAGLIVADDWRTVRDAISPEDLAHIVTEFPASLRCVLVSYHQSVKEGFREAETHGIKIVQICSQAQPDEVREIRTSWPSLIVWKSLYVTNDQTVREASEWDSVIDVIVLDTFDPTSDAYGGTGKIHDWTVSRRIVQGSRLPVYLAGGLRPDNVRSAIETVRPAGVIVNSGVKDKFGRKDPILVYHFVRLAKGMKDSGKKQPDCRG